VAEGLINTRGQPLNDVVVGVTCPWRSTSFPMPNPNNPDAIVVMAADQPCKRSCGVFSRKHDMCSVQVQANALPLREEK